MEWFEKHYLITLAADVDATIKFVEFRGGRGVLDMLTIARKKPHWVNSDAKGNFTPNPNHGGWTLDDYVAYFERNGAKVDPITASEAKKIHAEIDAAPVRERVAAPPPEPAAAEDTPAKPDSDDGKSDDPVEKPFRCRSCKHEFNAVDIGVSPVQCPECGKKTAYIRKS